MTNAASILLRSKIASYGYKTEVKENEHGANVVYAVKGDKHIDLGQVQVLQTMKRSRLEKHIDSLLREVTK